ncbi:MAG TPA: hypothetical protein VGE25_01770 [Sediminibacterium sp.]
MKFYINNLAELFSLGIAIIYYPYLKGSVMKWFLPFLVFITGSELYAQNIGYVLGNSDTPNTKIYGFVTIVESVFYGYFFYTMTVKEIWKKIILIISLINSFISIIFFFFIAENPSYLITNLLFLSICFSFISLTYIYSKFISDEAAYLLCEPGFWVAFGVTLFFSGVSVVFSLHDFILKHNLTLFGVKLYHIVPQILSLPLYLSISTAIILCKKKNRISL